VNAIAFADEGTLVSGSWDQAVRLWDLGPLRELREQPAEKACVITDRGLDPAEWDRYVGGLEYRDTCAP
jgi:WD40 repeat protein